MCKYPSRLTEFVEVGRDRPGSTDSKAHKQVQLDTIGRRKRSGREK